MPAPTGGVVLYAKDLARMSAFYAAVTGFAVAETQPDHVALESDAYSVVVVRIPDDIAAGIEIDTPPTRRRTPRSSRSSRSSPSSARPAPRPPPSAVPSTARTASGAGGAATSATATTRRATCSSSAGRAAEPASH